MALKKAPPGHSPAIRGMVRAVPIILGYVPIGLAFGVLAGQAGLTVPAVLGMSVIVFAGSSQFLAVAMLSGGAGLLPTVVATFFINLRHLLLSAALSPFLKRFGPGRLAPLAHTLTDESFAVHSAGYRAGLDPPYAELLSLNLAAQLTWVISTGLGCLAGNLIPEPASLGLDFALPAMFIGLLAGWFTNARQGLVALVAGLGVVAGTLAGLSTWSVILAASIAATVGMVRR